MNSYDIEFIDNEGDTMEFSCDTLAEAKAEMKKILKSGGRIVQTWIYKNDEYKGSF